MICHVNTLTVSSFPFSIFLSLPAGQRLKNIHLVILGNGIAQRFAVVDQFLADEDIDMLAQRPTFFDDIGAKPRMAFV